MPVLSLRQTDIAGIQASKHTHIDTDTQTHNNNQFPSLPLIWVELAWTVTQISASSGSYKEALLGISVCIAS